MIVLENEMASNVYCWQNLCKCTGATLKVIPSPVNEQRNLTAALLEALDETVAVLALSIVHWCDGSMINIEEIAQRVHSYPDDSKPFFIIDGTQSIGALPIDIMQLQPDYVTCSVHKWLAGPYGMSLVYLHPKHHNTWQPIDHHERSRKGSDQASWDEEG